MMMPSIQSTLKPQLQPQHALTLGLKPANTPNASVKTAFFFNEGGDTVRFSTTPRETEVSSSASPSVEDEPTTARKGEEAASKASTASVPVSAVVAPAPSTTPLLPAMVADSTTLSPQLTTLSPTTQNPTPWGAIGAALGGIALAGTIGLGLFWGDKNKKTGALEHSLQVVRQELKDLRDTVTNNKVFSQATRAITTDIIIDTDNLDDRLIPLEITHKLRNAMHELPEAKDKSSWVDAYFKAEYPDAATAFNGKPLRPIQIMRKKLLNLHDNGKLTFSPEQNPDLLKDARTFKEQVLQPLAPMVLLGKQHSDSWADFREAVLHFSSALAPITEQNEVAWASVDTAATLPKDAKAHEIIAHRIKKARIENNTDALEHSVTEAWGVLLHNFSLTKDLTLPKTTPPPLSATA